VRPALPDPRSDPAHAVFGQEHKSFVYKKTKQADLQMVVHFPPGWKESDQRPAMVFFFGGGWTGGTIRQFEPQASQRAWNWDGSTSLGANRPMAPRHNSNGGVLQ